MKPLLKAVSILFTAGTIAFGQEIDSVYVPPSEHADPWAIWEAPEDQYWRFPFSKDSFILEYAARKLVQDRSWGGGFAEDNPERKALVLFDAAIDADSGNYLAYFHKSEHLQHMGRREEALEILEETVKRWPDDPEPYRHIGEYYENQQLWEQQVHYNKIALQKVDSLEQAITLPIFQWYVKNLFYDDPNHPNSETNATLKMIVDGYKIGLIVDNMDAHWSLRKEWVKKLGELSPGLKAIFEDPYRMMRQDTTDKK